MKIRALITFSFTLVVAIILFLFSLAIFFSYDSYRKEDYYDRLISKANTTARFFLQVKEIDEYLLRIIDKNTLNSLYEEEVFLYDQDDKLLYHSIDEYFLKVTPELLQNIRKEKEVLFEYNERQVVGLMSGDHVVIASAYDQHGIKKAQNLKFILIFGSIVSLLLVVGVGWIFAGQMLAPISRITNEAESITHNNLHKRLNVGNGKDEIAQLGVSFNSLLNRLEAAFQSQKNFVSNVSHELRTPLAAVITDLEITLNKDRSTEEYKETITSALNDSRKMNELVHGLLDMAKASFDKDSISFKNVRLDEIILEARSTLMKKNASYGVTFNYSRPLEDDSQVMIKGNPYLLYTVFINLMDNGCKFSQAKKVNVTIGNTDDRIWVEFKDDGPGMSVVDLEHLYQPFYRGQNSGGVSGYGIGLSVVNRVVEVHDALISFKSSVEEGTTVTIYFRTLEVRS